VLAATLAAPPALLQPARAADAGIVYEVLAAIVENHVERPEPAKLLAGAVGGLREALTRAGVTAQLADLSATTESEARLQFQERFDQAVAQSGGSVPEVQLRYAAAAAMAASVGDSHTWFANPEQWREFVERTQGNPSFVGIGVLLLPRDGRFYIWRVFAGSPAEQAGLRAFDRIVTVDGQSTQNMSTQDLVSRVRGPAGTQVQIGVQRPGQAAPVTVGACSRSAPIISSMVAVLCRNSDSTARPWSWRSRSDSLCEPDGGRTSTGAGALAFQSARLRTSEPHTCWVPGVQTSPLA